VQKHFFWLFFGLCFRFRVFFEVCLVEVVVVEAFFQHGCGTEPIGCGSFYDTCGTLEDFFKAETLMLWELLPKTVLAPHQLSESS
jgi:hypothetical protein